MLAVAEAPFFYATFIGILTIGAAVVLVPGVAVLLLPLLVVMQRLARDRDLMGQLPKRTRRHAGCGGGLRDRGRLGRGAWDRSPGGGLTLSRSAPRARPSPRRPGAGSARPALDSRAAAGGRSASGGPANPRREPASPARR